MVSLGLVVRAMVPYLWVVHWCRIASIDPHVLVCESPALKNAWTMTEEVEGVSRSEHGRVLAVLLSSVHCSLCSVVEVGLNANSLDAFVFSVSAKYSVCLLWMAPLPTQSSPPLELELEYCSLNGFPPEVPSVASSLERAIRRYC